MLLKLLWNGLPQLNHSFTQELRSAVLVWMPQESPGQGLRCGLFGKWESKQEAVREVGSNGEGGKVNSGCELFTTTGSCGSLLAWNPWGIVETIPQNRPTEAWRPFIYPPPIPCVEVCPRAWNSLLFWALPVLSLFPLLSFFSFPFLCFPSLSIPVLWESPKRNSVPVTSMTKLLTTAAGGIRSG